MIKRYQTFQVCELFRLEKINEEFGDNVLTSLHGAHFAVYGVSSDILHGNYYGVAYYMDLLEPNGRPNNAEEWIESIGGKHLMVLMAATLSIASVVKSFSKVTGLNEFSEYIDKQIQELKKAPFFKGDNEKGA